MIIHDAYMCKLLLDPRGGVENPSLNLLPWGLQMLVHKKSCCIKTHSDEKPKQKPTNFEETASVNLYFVWLKSHKKMLFRANSTEQSLYNAMSGIHRT